MGENTKIEWTDHTFNPWIGCTKVAPECANCYAEHLAERWKLAEWGKGKPRHHTSETYWRQPLKWNRAAEQTGERRRVFCASLADVFDSEVDAAWRADLFDLIRQTPALDWLLLTKRPENISPMLPDSWGEGWPNVWLGTSVGHPDSLWRVDELVKVAAAVRFLSCEPLLARIDLEPWLTDPNPQAFVSLSRYYGPDGFDPTGSQVAKTRVVNPKVSWVIVGGESGSGARPMHPDWARFLRDQCQAADVPFFFKQWGEWFPVMRDARSRVRLADDPLWYLWPDEGDESPVSKRVGKKEAGRLLDGETWSQFPAAGAPPEATTARREVSQ